MPITITITRNADGSVVVDGPVHDKIVFYGMLEFARDVVQGHHDRLAKSPIVAATELPSALHPAALHPRG